MTTGRINQVATLRDAERRPWAGARPSFGTSYKGHGGASPLPHGMHWVRERSAPARTTGPVTARWSARGASASSGAPRGGAGRRGPFFMRIAPIERAGNTKPPRRDASNATSCYGPRPARGIGRRQFGGPSTEPADGYNPSTTHTPAQALERHHLGNHTPPSRG